MSIIFFKVWSPWFQLGIIFTQSSPLFFNSSQAITCFTELGWFIAENKIQTFNLLSKEWKSILILLDCARIICILAQLSTLLLKLIDQLFRFCLKFVYLSIFAFNNLLYSLIFKLQFLIFDLQFIVSLTTGRLRLRWNISKFPLHFF